MTDKPMTGSRPPKTPFDHFSDGGRADDLPDFALRNFLIVISS
jgi:hypothetical protein